MEYGMKVSESKSKVVCMNGEVNSFRSAWFLHLLHLTDGNDASCFIAVHARANAGAQKAAIIVAKMWQCGYRGTRLLSG